MTSLIGYLLKEAVKQRRNIVVIIVIVLFCVGYLVEIDLEALKFLLVLGCLCGDLILGGFGEHIVDIGGYILGIGAVNKAEEVVKILLNLLFLGFGLLELLGNIDRCLYLRYLLLGGLLRLRFFRRFLLFGGFGPRN